MKPRGLSLGAVALGAIVDVVGSVLGSFLIVAAWAAKMGGMSVQELTSRLGRKRRACCSAGSRSVA